MQGGVINASSRYTSVPLTLSLKKWDQKKSVAARSRPFATHLLDQLYRLNIFSLSIHTFLHIALFDALGFKLQTSLS